MRGKFISGYLMDIRHMPAWVILLVYLVLLKCCLTLALSDNGRNNWVVLKAKSANEQFLLTQLQKQNLTLLFKTIPSIYIFQYNGSDRYQSLHDVLQSVLHKFPGEVIEAEPLRIYEDTLKPYSTFDQAPGNTYLSSVDLDHYYGRDIVTTWSRGYSGKGVTIAVTGVGLETTLLDLQRNINLSLCYNFVESKSDVTPEVFRNTQKKALQLADHGNRIASVITAEKDNRFCGAGIAYGSTIVGIKMLAIRAVGGPSPFHWTTSDIVSKAFAHKLDDIDIFVNAWTTTIPFDRLDLATREAIDYGATKGRRGRGTVHVVPAGPVGSLLSNNIHTITVGMLGQDGTTPSGALSDASVLTSGFGDGSNLTSTEWVTSSHNNKCINSFKGYSAAVSHVSGIIALGLEANPYLSLRDIQHLLVLASDHNGLEVSSIFKQNGAGHYFHEKFGFGLLNAEKFVSLSGKRKPTPSLLYRTVQLTSEISKTNNQSKKLVFCYTCDVATDKGCLTTVEHVVISIDFNTSYDAVKMVIQSSSGTRSTVMNLIKQGNTQTKRQAHIVSTNFWNEKALGSWTVIVQTPQSSSQLHIGTVSLTLYGTRNEIHFNNDDNRRVIDNFCANIDQSTSTVDAPDVAASASEASSAESGKDNKINIPLVVILPIGVLVMCGIMGFILMRGNGQGPVSVFGEPVKRKIIPRRRLDSDLHRQISLLRQKSRQESTSEEVEDDMDKIDE